MKTLYFECNMGAAGDMLMAALLELVPDKDAAIQKLNNLGLDDVHVAYREETKCGIVGTHVHVHIHGQEEHSHDVHGHTHDDTHTHEHDHDHGHLEHEHSHGHGHHEHKHHTHEHEHVHAHEHSHSHSHGGHSHDHIHSALDDIAHTIGHMPVSELVKQNAIAVYTLIAEAESHAHGVPVSDIHFHEVGTLDAVVDVVGVCYLMELVAPEQILASPIHVGSGQVKCAHGILPVPAPATAHILRGVPIYGGRIKGELCTPTGAALLKHFVQSFGDMPVMTTEKIGYGMGTKDFEDANCVRAYLGDTQESADDVVEFSCNLDDITGEAIGYATEVLLNAGALDVYTTPIYMKKNRPGVMLSCLCKKADSESFAALLFKHTTTIGVRQQTFSRYTLERFTETHTSPLGEVHVKHSSGYGNVKAKPEYEDIAKIAKEKGLSYSEVLMQIVKEL